MTFTLFFPDYQFQKLFFYVSLGNIFLLFFCEGPLVVEDLGNCPVYPLLNPALVLSSIILLKIRKRWASK